MNQHVDYSEMELELITAHYLRPGGPAFLVATLGRSLNAIQAKASRMGLPKKRPAPIAKVVTPADITWRYPVEPAQLRWAA